MRKIFFIIVFVLIIGIIIWITILKKGGKKMQENIEGGVVKDIKLDGYDDIIKSEDITYFEYSGRSFYCLCEKKDGKVHIISEGGNSNKRDGSYFKLDYESNDDIILNDLQSVVKKYNLSLDNGHEHVVAGLPSGLGDFISVIYSSNEKIWKYSNQHTTVSDDAASAIYDTFHNLAIKNGFDFTSEKSNVILYDDASLEYLQGTWEGKHFGDKYRIIFEGNHVKIYENDKLTDDTDFIIVEGFIVMNKYRDGIFAPRNRHDYEEFSVISTMRKKNDFTIVAYFTKDSYSTCDLFKKE